METSEHEEVASWMIIEKNRDTKLGLGGLGAFLLRGGGGKCHYYWLDDEAMKWECRFDRTSIYHYSGFFFVRCDS